MFLRKFYENVSEKNEDLLANLNNYFTSRSNFDNKNEVFDENKDNAFNETSDDNENFQDISQITSR